MTTAVLRRITVVCALLLVAAACSEDNKVGTGVDLSVGAEGEELRLGETTTTSTTAPVDDDDGGALTVGETTTTTAAPTTTTTAAPEKVAITISINSDTSGSTQFVPSAARVFAGSLVEWVNKDSVARSVEFSDGSVNSGMLAPGATFRYRAAETGQFDYTDGTRPYAVGTLEVVPR